MYQDSVSPQRVLMLADGALGILAKALARLRLVNCTDSEYAYRDATGEHDFPHSSCDACS